MRKEVKHIGVISPICGANPKEHGSIREDLTVKEYQNHFYSSITRPCKRCLSVIRTGSHIEKRYGKKAIYPNPFN